MVPFHLAIPVHDLEEARRFYGDVLGCKKGREDEHWIDWDFWQHQVVTHLAPFNDDRPVINDVDNKSVPVPHFGVVLEWNDWEHLVQRMRDFDIKFALEPYIRFKGEKGEQGTFFVKDPSDNALEFKTFKNMNQLFEK